MNMINPPNLKISGFSMVQVNPGDNLVTNPYTGKRDLYRKSPGSWQGTVRWGTGYRRKEQYDNNRRFLIRFHTSLQGYNNIVEFTLPLDYQTEQEIPDASVFTLSSSVLSEAGVVFEISGQNNDMYMPEASDYFNIGGRLFFARTVSGTPNSFILTAFPAIIPTLQNVSLADVSISATLDATQEIGREGQNLISHTFPFWEAI